MVKSKWWRLLAALFAATLIAASCSSDSDSDNAGGGDGSDDTVNFNNTGDGGLLDTILDRGTLKCGVNATLSGFGILNEDGEHVGFDIDLCKAVAAAMFGSSEGNIEYVDLTAEQRFTALQTGEADILIRNTTWTATRDGAEALRFGPTMFYDGQGFMVPSSTGFTEPADLEGARICVQSSTTNELNLTAFLDSQGVDFEPDTYESNTELRPAYEAGSCEAITSDRSQLASLKADIEKDGGEEQTIFGVTISKEPLGPSVLDGNPDLAELMDWTMYALIQAEEFGIDSSNVASFESENNNVQKFLGQVEDFDSGLPLSSDFAINVISEVGNYQEIYDRHMPGIGLSERGVNALWTDGGLLYAPPYV